MKISIIIPTYNEEKYIADALTSLTSHLTLPHEIIVTDDKSTDTTLSLVQGKADIVVMALEKHRSIGENRNDGARRATGDILVFMDCDSRLVDHDVLFSHALKRFENDPHLVALVGPLKVWEKERTLADALVYFFFNLISIVKNNILHIGEGSGKFQIIRKSSFEKVGGFREDLVASEDADMIYRLSKIGKTRYDSEIQVFHSGRRAHRIGWPRLLWIWTWERLYAFLFNKSHAKEWVDIR